MIDSVIGILQLPREIHLEPNETTQELLERAVKAEMRVYFPAKKNELMRRIEGGITLDQVAPGPFTQFGAPGVRGFGHGAFESYSRVRHFLVESGMPDPFAEPERETGLLLVPRPTFVGLRNRAREKGLAPPPNSSRPPPNSDEEFMVGLFETMAEAEQQGCDIYVSWYRNETGTIGLGGSGIQIDVLETALRERDSSILPKLQEARTRNSFETKLRQGTAEGHLCVARTCHILAGGRSAKAFVEWADLHAFYYLVQAAGIQWDPLRAPADNHRLFLLSSEDLNALKGACDDAASNRLNARLITRLAALNDGSEAPFEEENGDFRFGLREEIAPDVRAFVKKKRGREDGLFLLACGSWV